METFLIIGAKGRGKSTAARKRLQIAKSKNREIVIYDPNREYSEFYNKEFISDEKRFLEMVKPKKNTTLLIEEATIFFTGQNQSREMRDLLVRARHTNNEIILCFHSLRSIPTYILELVNYLILFKTTERENYVESKFAGFDEIIEAFTELKSIPDNNRQNFHKCFVVELNKPVAYI